MPFDRATALAEADDCERKLMTLYFALKIPAAFLKLVDGVLIVRCEAEADVAPLCQAVVTQHYTLPEGATLN